MGENGEITDFKMRCEKSKYTTVKACSPLATTPLPAVTAQRPWHDPGKQAGFLFKSTDAIKAEYPEIPAYETYDELYDAIMKAIKN